MLRKIILPIYLGFVLFCILSFFSGTGGIQNLKKIEYFYNSLEKHTRDIEVRNQMLLDEISLLETNEDRITLAARPLGLVVKGDKAIKVLNYSIVDSLYTPLRKIDLPEIKKSNNGIFIISFMFSIFVFISGMFIGVIRDIIKRK